MCEMIVRPGDYRAVSNTTRCTTLVPMPSFLPIFRMPMPSARSCRIRASTAGFTRTSAKLDAVRPSPRKATVDTPTHDAALELGKPAQHLKHRLAGGRRGVEALLMKEEVNALVVQALQDAEEIRQRSTEPINRPCRNYVELFGVHRLHQGVESGALAPALGAADPGIFIDPDDLPSRAHHTCAVKR